MADGEREARGGQGELLFHGSITSTWEDEKFWKRIVKIVLQHCEYT